MPDPIQPPLPPGEEPEERLKQGVGKAYVSWADTTICP